MSDEQHQVIDDARSLLDLLAFVPSSGKDWLLVAVLVVPWATGIGMYIMMALGAVRWALGGLFHSVRYMAKRVR